MTTTESALTRCIDVINSLGAQTAGDLCDLVLSFLLSPNNSNFQEGVIEFSSQHKLSSSTAKLVTQGVVYQVQEALFEGYNAKRFEEKCREYGYTGEVVAKLTSVWVSRAVNVATSLLSRAMTNNQLIDMDWIFGVTASSDDCNHVGKTFLQLKLTLDSSTGKKTVLIELSLEQFYLFLASMEKCKSYLDYVSPQSV